MLFIERELQLKNIKKVIIKKLLSKYNDKGNITKRTDFYI